MNVLAIAPYQELLPLMEQAAAEYPELEVTCMVGNLDEAVLSALTIFHRGFDAVISRGGTVATLEDEITVPVVSINVSTLDILRSLHGAGITQGRVAAVGFTSTLRRVGPANEIFEGQIDAYPVDFDDELDEVFEELAGQPYDAVMGDTIACELAAKHGFATVPLQSGYESVLDAFDRTAQLLTSSQKSVETVRLLRDVIKTQGIRVAIFSAAGELSFSSFGDEDLALLEELARHARAGNPPARFLFRHEGTLYTVHALVSGVTEDVQTIFSVTSSRIPGKDRFSGITYHTAADIEQAYHDCAFYLISAEDEFIDIAHHAGANDRPIIIEGETGCGKPRVAQLIYLSSGYRAWPYVEINCDLLDDSSWNFLISDYRSPLYETKAYLYFRAIHMLPSAQWRELLGAIQRSALHERCKLVISANYDAEGNIPPVSTRFSDALGCFTITVPPLRRMHLTGEATDRYLAHLAARDGVAAPVLDEEARTIVESYHWPRNILQFRQVLKWAYAAAEDGVVSAADIREALNRDATAKFSASSTPESDSMLDLLKPLSETTTEIARLVVEAYGGNKTAAAKTLGISRTTLWSMLKRQ